MFFLYAGVEVRQALLPEGALENWSKRTMPLIATAGGVLGPIVAYKLLSAQFAPEFGSGWVIPTATDIVFALLVSDMVFGNAHPARILLLALAVLDDGVGLILIPTVYSDGVDWLPFLVGLVAVVAASAVLHLMHVKKARWYILVSGIPSWLLFIHFGVEPALALLPIVWFMPHGKADVGLFAPWYSRRERQAHDTLSNLGHKLERDIVPIVMLGFGLANAGLGLGIGNNLTLVVVLSLMLGKFVGISVFTIAGVRLLGAKLPSGMRLSDTYVMAAIASIGFTVALFVAGVAFAANPEASENARLGAFFSLGTGLVLSMALAALLGVRRVTTSDTNDPSVQSVYALD
jgi:NhaA family Na+:H+ antiporter